MSKVASLIITYNPDERLLNLVETIYHQVGLVIIVDNFSDNTSSVFIHSIQKEYPEVKVIKNNENFGIAKALNQGLEEARNSNIDHVLTFDQDSTPFDNIVSVISEVYDSYNNKAEIGAIGVGYVSNHNERFVEGNKNQLYFEKDYLITSGCMISVDTFFKIGGFREDFFIDNVDIEYSLRLKKNGKRSLITTKPGMIHKAGDPLRKKVLGFTIISSNHSSFRRYFMSRNHVIVTRDYFLTNPYFILKLNFFYILSIIKIIVVEKDIKSKLKSSYRGFKDAFNYSLPAK
ncbi:glycosyltransferase family 2 protein [Chryseobacterium gwangjuense]|uniref:glycosyltransferase family 2 protein n=1 Tax=Chryseobacterium gwangjuense TaxID=1069980 RepID=UPI001E5B5CEE|nr:glycosyltransferase family 2 protein [Chryseobacterium gwangjuense]MCE3076900.1 glycosyltransferase family 2 protein [Chryseobacterium gwangjuense]